ncbi:MAG: cobalamin-dependent protein, partial [Firmicutes bacterium]|nr:cobalamin-dependent protein [Bacillota bacterium]
MNVLLVRPRPHADTIGLQSMMICEPLELEYLAAMVQDHHQVSLIDLIIDKKPLLYHLQQIQPQVVALTAYIAHVNVIKEYARIIKSFDPTIHVVIGGVHAEVVPEDFFDPHIDFIVAKNPLQNFSSLLTQMEAGTEGVLPKVITNPGTHASPAEEFIPPVFPKRSITAHYRHRYYYIYHNPCALLKTSYGCPYTCSFCFCRQVTDGGYFERKLTDVIEEIKGITEPEIYIVDDNFLVDPQRVRQFCSLLEDHSIDKHFLIYGRADFIAAHEDIIARFAQVGLRAVIVGVESPNPQELEKYNKKSSVLLNEQAIRVLAKYDVDCYATLIVGIDWTKEDFFLLQQWLQKMKLRFINLQPFTPLPGTPVYDDYQDQLLIPRDCYQQWDLANLVVQPSNISVRRYYYY